MKRKLDESGIDNGSTSIKRGCYFQCITSVLFRRGRYWFDFIV